MRGTSGNPNMKNELGDIFESMIKEFCEEFDIDEHKRTDSAYGLNFPKIKNVDNSWSFLGNDPVTDVSYWNKSEHGNQFYAVTKTRQENGVLGFIILKPFKANIYQLIAAKSYIKKQKIVQNLIETLLHENIQIISDNIMTIESEGLFLNLHDYLYSYNKDTRKEIKWGSELEDTPDDPRPQGHDIKPAIYWLLKI